MAVIVKKFATYFIQRENKIQEFFVVFYLIGSIGMLLPITYPLFIKLIPLTLLLNFFVLPLFHKGEVDRKTIFGFVLIYILSFFIEAVGVSTGKIFGFYYYGSGLGIKLFETPLIIGINWLFLVYATASITGRLRISPLFQILLASLAMVVYDFILEQVAPKLDMWYWQNETVPPQNYLSWFLLALLFHSIFKILNIRTVNNVTDVIILCQFVFFLVLFVFS